MSATLEPVETTAPPHAPVTPSGGTPPASAVAAADDAPDTRLHALVVFAAVLAVSLLVQRPHPLGVFTDDAMYAILARSLLDGEGYRFINLPGSPPGTHFPPVYPALLALLWKLSPNFPENVGLFKSVNALLNALAALLAFRFAVGTLRLHRNVAAFAAVVAGIGVPSLLLSGMVLSEPLFLVLLLAALPLAERVRRDPTTGRALLLGALAGVIVLTRSIGVTFVGGVVLALLLSRRWRAAGLVGATALAFMLPWQLWVARHDAEIPAHLRGKYGSYSGWLSQGVERHGASFVVKTVERNLPQVGVVMSEPLRVPRWKWMPRMVWTHYLGMAVAGVLGALGLVALWGTAPAAALTLVAYFAMVVVWPFDPTRFLWGVWPFFVVTLAAGAQWAASRARPVRLAGLGIAGAGALGAVAHLTYGLQHDWSSALPAARANSGLPIVFWVQEHTRPTDVVTSDEEAMVWLYTGRRGTPNSRFTPDEYIAPPTDSARRADFDTVIARHDPDWMIVSMEPVKRPALQRAAERGDLRQVGVLPDGGLIFERMRHSTRDTTRATIEASTR